jgi:hypothetical protein
MKNIFTPSLFLFMSAGFITLQSCQKTDTLNNPLPSTLGATNKGGTGGGGGNTGGGGSNSGGGGGSTFTPPPPTDSTTSLLPVADIITVGNWKVTYYVQGKDNLTTQFANYIFTFNSDGSMIADDNGNQAIGTWHYQDAVFYYGIPVYGSSPYGFTMNIGYQLPLINLDKNYFISKKTLTTVYIDSVNPNENAHAVFSKL